MALIFDAASGVTVDPADDIRDSIRTAFKQAFRGDGLPELNTDAETPAGQLVDSLSALVTEKDSDILFLSNQFNPETAEGKWQEALAKIYFIERKGAQPTIVECVCTGREGTVIPSGSIVQTNDGKRLSSIENATINETGSVSVEFRCVDVGPIAVTAGSVKEIVTVVPGWDLVTNPAPGVVGREEESRLEFEKRRYASVAINGRGSVYALYAAIADLDGVLDVAVIENSTDQSQTISGLTIAPHSVCCSVYGGNGDDIAKAIYQKKPAGCGTSGNTTLTYMDPEFPVLNSYRIYRPTATPIKINVRLATASGSLNDVISTVKNALIDDFYGRSDNNRVTMNATLYASRFYSVMTKLGITSLVMATVAIGSGEAGNSVFVPANIEPTLSEEDITVTFDAE